MQRATEPMPSMVLRVSNVVSYLLLILINTLANKGFFGPTNADVSKQYRTPLTPAGWAFSIWGIIFALQGVGAIYAALPMGYASPAKRAAVNTIGYGWQLTWLFECCWLVLFPRQTMLAFVGCAVLLFAGLASIATTCTRVYRANAAMASVRATAPAAREAPTSKAILYALYFLPTSMNTAWLSVASCLGVTVLAASQDAGLGTQNVLAACLAALVSAIGVFILLQHGDLAYAATLIWALSAVLDAQRVELVRMLAVLAIVVLGLVSGLTVYRRWKLRRQQLEAASVEAASAALQESLLAPEAAAGGVGVGPSGVATM
eukprot:GHRQ01001388.1.p1 GENE.GHRQ01001388.1~~GHRQ01001388.1.p1  ORF type:complete len:318 (+),score=87.53 GHRQ01001388.1:246-1199(+)